ncbi:hypothetical protein MAR_003505 [Mya arenaria]|uniref:Uncharacterized protein n=1 Tax=Mya arenaria TaxID=6604 RepID=A0ABY7G9B1_MYAAR|nr:hypothetical protein MAR_003505 [Mya arenaria]
MCCHFYSKISFAKPHGNSYRKETIQESIQTSVRHVVLLVLKCWMCIAHAELTPERSHSTLNIRF